MIKPDLSTPLPETLGSIHFVGIGGSGMSALARLFLEAGHRVTGSDRSENAAIGSLRDAGATISIGHDAAHLGDAEALVYTSALWPDNPEYLAAIERGIPVLHRSQALAFLVRGSRLVAVAGAHGKTTTTGMIVTALRAVGREPSFVNGGVIQSLGRSSGFGDPRLWIIEADESDGSFLLYDPAVAVVTNVDADHLDHYGTREAFDEAFVRFVEGASERVIVSADDPGARRVEELARHSGRSLRFGEREPSADIRIVDVDEADGRVAFTIRFEHVAHRVALRVPGRHNALNAAAAFGALVALGLEPGDAARGLEAFEGTERRFEFHAEIAGVRVYDDYAHHPTEVEAALAQARSVVGDGGRVIAVHQPHLYSRTRLMADRFARVYEQLADHTVVLDVFGAREDPEPGVSGALVANAFTDPSRVDFIPDWDEAARRVARIARPGDLVMTLSCGDVYRIIPQLVEAIGSNGDHEAS